MINIFGQRIKFSGFVYRLSDFGDEQFVLGREMIVSSDNSLATKSETQVVVVGFMCNCSEAESFDTMQWVEIEGVVSKGYYHNDIPIIEVDKITKTNCPSNPYVYPPDNSYVRTDTI